MKDTIFEAIEDALTEVTERPVLRLTEDMELDREFDLDSFMFVQFLMSLEDKVENLRFDPAVMGENDFNSVGNLASYISVQTQVGAR